LPGLNFKTPRIILEGFFVGALRIAKFVRICNII